MGTVTNSSERRKNVTSTGFANLSETTSIITTVDTAAQRFTRQRVGGDGRIEELALNTPRNGLRHRDAGDVPTTGGGTVRVSELINMPLPGTGMSVFTRVAPNQNFFGISLAQP